MTPSPERAAQLDLSAEEVDVLDRVLQATAARGAGARQQRLGVVELLQSPAGSSLCRQVMALRDVRRASPPAVLPWVAIAARSGPLEPSQLRTDWPSGKWTEEIAILALSEHARSGLAETAFCAATGISRGRIRRWRRKLTAAHESG